MQSGGNTEKIADGGNRPAGCATALFKKNLCGGSLDWLKLPLPIFFHETQIKFFAKQDLGRISASRE